MSTNGLSGRAATLVNYDPKQPTLASLVPWRNPALVKIFFSFEFWFYINFHSMIVFLSLSGAVPLLPVDWKASGAFQYFTTFFLTFYNGNCYARYQSLYTACCDLMDATLLFVREMTITFKEPETWKHRLQATKWLLAAVDLFFMGVCGNKLNMKEWTEVVKKGLLTKPEAQLLLKYPGPEVVPILTTWVMIAIGDALELPTFHERRDPAWTCVRGQKIAHLHNRLDLLMSKLMKSYRLISETMAQPIPFAYWHLMNLVFSLNFLLLALILASFQHWLTIVPFSMALMTFMGLREVSNQLADPFGDDIVDFPLAKYLDYTFDHAVCLLQAFSTEDAYERVRRQIKVSSPFNERQVRRHMKPENLYSVAYAAHQDNIYIWEKEQPLQECAVVYEKESLQDQLKKSLSAIPVGKTSVEYGDEDDSADFQAKPHGIEENQVRWLQDAEEELERLRAAAPEAARELEALEGRADDMAEDMIRAQSSSEPMGHAKAARSSMITHADVHGEASSLGPRLMPPPGADAGGGIGALLAEPTSPATADGNQRSTGRPNAPKPPLSDGGRSNGSSRSGRNKRIAEPFEWTSNGQANRSGSDRPGFRMADVNFQLVTDASGRLQRQGQQSAGTGQDQSRWSVTGQRLSGDGLWESEADNSRARPNARKEQAAAANAGTKAPSVAPLDVQEARINMARVDRMEHLPQMDHDGFEMGRTEHHYAEGDWEKKFEKKQDRVHLPPRGMKQFE